MAEAWIELPVADYESTWRRIHREFRFRPSINPADWPVFAEPPGSATWSVDGILPRADSPSRARERELATAARDVLLTHVPEPLFALNWQHNGYAFRPSRMVDPHDLNSWLVPVCPNGDYVIFLSQDYAAGLLGQPWERTLCVFGDRLVPAFSLACKNLLGPPVRMRAAGAPGA
ncbi:DUF2716 domain-containing protein [Streptomyces sp. NBC_00988]|uniref:DUF2716 domain-containing protein n=1 Tax=Streptomyces sp. NBC_00988 TaxID=2903704 RepID=UPI00386AF122|nr:DUF2716 domain-containing protein [Streptomyces sp. NBC_00988]